MKSIMRHFTKRDWFATAGAVVLIALSVWLELLMPDYMKEITELLITPTSSISPRTTPSTSAQSYMTRSRASRWRRSTAFPPLR